MGGEVPDYFFYHKHRGTCEKCCFSLFYIITVCRQLVYDEKKIS